MFSENPCGPQCTRQAGEGQGRWGKAFGNHTPMAPHTLARNLGGTRPREAVGFQPTHGKLIQRSSSHKLTSRETLPCASLLWGCVGGGAGPRTGPDNCSHLPCQDFRAWGSSVWLLLPHPPRPTPARPVKSNELIKDTGLAQFM